MTGAVTTIVLVAAIGSALVGGIFYAFSSFVMKALARVPASEGIAAMRSINVAVLNPSFLGLFVGTAAISLLLALVAVGDWGSAREPFRLAGAALYLVGTFAVTAFGNVPLNDRLARVSTIDPESLALWEHYLDRWTWLNTVRTAAATGAALLFTIGLMRRCV